MITFSLKTLREALAGLRVLKPARQALPALRCVRVVGNSDSVRLDVATPDEHLLFEGAGRSDDVATGKVLVPWETLDGVARSADAGSDIAIEPFPQPTIRCLSGGAPVILPFRAEPPGDFPAVPTPAGRPPVGLPSAVLASMVEAADCASTESNRYLINGVFVEKHAVVATDGRQLYARNSLDLPLPDEGLVFPLSGVPAAIGKTAGDTLLFTTWKHGTSPVARLASGPWMWTTRLIPGKYPNWRQVIPKPDGYKAHLRISDEDAARLRTVLPRLPGFRDKHSPVCLTIREEGAFLNPPPHLPQVRVELGRSRVIRVPEGEDIGDVQFDANYLLGALRRGFRDLHVCDDVTPVVMRDGHRVNIWTPNRPRVGPPPAKTSATPSAAPAPEPKAADLPDAEPASPQAASTNENKNATGDNPAASTTRNESTTMVAIAQPRIGNSTDAPGIVAAAPQKTHVTAAPEAQASGVDAAQQSIQRARDLLRELNGTLGNLQVFIRESVRQQKALERDHETLKKNIRALRAVEV